VAAFQAGRNFGEISASAAAVVPGRFEVRVSAWSCSAGDRTERDAPSI
jgi:hypothetical protein